MTLICVLGERELENHAVRDAPESVTGGLDVSLRPGELWWKGMTIFKIEGRRRPLKGSPGGKTFQPDFNIVGLEPGAGPEQRKSMSQPRGSKACAKPGLAS